MRTPSLYFFRKYSKFIVIFIFGMIAGAVLFMYIHSQTMNDIMLENRYLVSTNNKLLDEIRAMEEDFDALHQQNEETVRIKKIEIDITDEEDDLDGFIETEIVDLLREDLRPLINTSLEDMASTQTAVRNLIDDRRYETGDQEFEIEFESMVIYTTLTIQVSVHKIS